MVSPHEGKWYRCRQETRQKPGLPGSDFLNVPQTFTVVAYVRGCAHLHSSPIPWGLWNWGLFLAGDPCFQHLFLWNRNVSTSRGRRITVSSRPACSAHWVSRQPGVHRKTCLKNQNRKMKPQTLQVNETRKSHIEQSGPRKVNFTCPFSLESPIPNLRSEYVF